MSGHETEKERLSREIRERQDALNDIFRKEYAEVDRRIGQALA